MKFENRYAWSERLLHNCAFGSPGLQVALADIEDQMFRRRLADVTIDRPVFVTALPRAGTTVLLNLLVATGAFASHTYRDMPFVLCPMLWNELAKGFHTQNEARERAHGDGVLVSTDSPEAFEEIVWKYFWKAHYAEDRIVPWSACDDPEFLSFFASHMRKVVALRSAAGGGASRYLSKNNSNISRLACLPRVFATGRFIVLFREPLQHAASLLKQHTSFLDMHAGDAFARRYMEGIGHHDFGANLRPVNFDGWLTRDRRPDAVGLEFWLEYWIAAYRSITSLVGDRVRLVSYAALTAEPRRALESLASFLSLADPSALTRQASSLRPPRDHDVEVSGVGSRLVDEARELYSRLELQARDGEAGR
jgi:hypothetical protein